MLKQCQNLLKEYVQGVIKAREVNPEGIRDLTTRFAQEGLAGKRPNVWNMVNEYSINSLLSGTGTPVVNVLSNSIQTLMKPTLEVIKSIPKGQAARREALAMWSAIFDGAKLDLMFLQKGFKTGLPADFVLTPKALGMTEKKFNELLVDLGGNVDQTGNVPADVAQKILSENYDYITHAIKGPAGNIIRIPTRLTVGIDEYFKARLRHQKIFGLLSKMASRDEEAGKGNYEDLYNAYKTKAFQGPDRADYVAKLDEMFGDRIDTTLAIYDIKNYATDGTFQTKLTGPLASVEKLKGQGSTAAETAVLQALPFLRTPWNIALESTSYVPGVGFAIRPKKTVTKAVQIGEETSYRTEQVKMPLEDIVARQVVGFGMVSTVAALWNNERITGAEPQDAQGRTEWQIQGKKPYSIKMGDQWISYARLDPLTTTLGMTVDALEFGKRAKAGEFRDVRGNPVPEKMIEEANKAAWSTVKANVMSKTFFQGFADVFDAISSDNSNKLVTYLENVGKRAVPNLLNTIARATDPAEREAITFPEKLQQRIPGARQELPLKYAPVSPTPGQLEPMKTDMMQAIFGIGVGKEQTDFQKKLSQLDLRTMPKSSTLEGVKLTSQQLSDYKKEMNKEATRMLGNDIDKLIGMKNNTIASNIAKKRLMAAARISRNRLKAKYPELREELRDEKLLKKYGPGGLQ